MSKITTISKIKFWILKALQVQLFMNLISLPILINWGLPISLLSIFGNVLFGPILALFLFLSSIIFFLEVIYVPNQWLIYCLEKITVFWIYLLSFSSNKYLLSLPATTFFIIFIPFWALFIIHNKKTNTLKRSTIGFAFIFLISVLIAYTLKPKLQISQSINTKDLFIINKNNKTFVYDHKNTLSKYCSNSFMEYNFITHLSKNFGQNNIETLILYLNQKSLENCKFLLSKITIKKIVFITSKNNTFVTELIELQSKTNVTLIDKKELKGWLLHYYFRHFDTIA